MFYLFYLFSWEKIMELIQSTKDLNSIFQKNEGNVYSSFTNVAISWQKKNFRIFLQQFLFLILFFHNNMINFDESIDRIFDNELFETFA